MSRRDRAARLGDINPAKRTDRDDTAAREQSSVDDFFNGMYVGVTEWRSPPPAADHPYPWTVGFFAGILAKVLFALYIGSNLEGFLL